MYLFKLKKFHKILYSLTQSASNKSKAKCFSTLETFSIHFYSKRAALNSKKICRT